MKNVKTITLMKNNLQKNVRILSNIWKKSNKYVILCSDDCPYFVWCGLHLFYRGERELFNRQLSALAPSYLSWFCVSKSL